MIGRIRVDGKDHRVHGYLTLTGDVALVSEDINTASVFVADSSVQTLRVKGQEKSLVIKAAVISYSLRPGTYHFGYIARSSANLGSQWSEIWSVTGDSNVVTSPLKANGRKCDAKFVMTTNEGMTSIYIPADMDVFSAEFGEHTVATLYFETMS
ncbi:hypothetical protein FS837_012806 [Tulasnella sp. UAMH 9824]|nr:hypothetical protein FS837_012806 [Tulasnella sp. UAMH 9824]